MRYVYVETERKGWYEYMYIYVHISIYITTIRYNQLLLALEINPSSFASRDY